MSRWTMLSCEWIFLTSFLELLGFRSYVLIKRKQRFFSKQKRALGLFALFQGVRLKKKMLYQSKGLQVHLKRNFLQRIPWPSPPLCQELVALSLWTATGIELWYGMDSMLGSICLENITSFNYGLLKIRGLSFHSLDLTQCFTHSRHLIFLLITWINDMIVWHTWIMIKLEIIPIVL